MTGIPPGASSQNPAPPSKRSWERDDGEQPAQENDPILLKNNTKRVRRSWIGNSSTAAIQEWAMPSSSRNVWYDPVRGLMLPAPGDNVATSSRDAYGLAVNADTTTHFSPGSYIGYDGTIWSATRVQGPCAWESTPDREGRLNGPPQGAPLEAEANDMALETPVPTIRLDLVSCKGAPAVAAPSLYLSNIGSSGTESDTPPNETIHPAALEDEGSWRSTPSLHDTIGGASPGTPEDSETLLAATESPKPTSEQDVLLSASDEDEYEVCLGLLEIDDLPLHKLDEKLPKPKPVKLSFCMDIMLVHDAESGAYHGLVSSNSSKAMARLHQKYNVTLSPTVHGTHTKTLSIVLYGAFKDAQYIGDMLMDYDCFLQRPDDFDACVPYQNPQSYAESVSQANTESMMMGHGEKTSRKFSATTAVLESKTAELLDCASGPEEFTEQKASERLSTELKWFQKKALAMMAEKESGKMQGTEFPSVWTEEVNSIQNKSLFINNVTSRRTLQRPKLSLGGLLADDMGLGKSLTTLALIAGSITDESRNTRRGGSTIIVAPLSTLPNWENQIRTHFHEGSLTFSVYHGPKRHKILDNIEEYDIVLATYDTLSVDYPNPCSTDKGDAERRTVYDTSWHRIVLDEAHVIRNRASRQFRAVCCLEGRHRWCLTGTPIQNTIDDLGALVTFLRVSPFDDGTVFRGLFISTSSSNETQQWSRLKRLVRAISLRRTKQTLGAELQIPAKEEVTHYVSLNEEEASQYNHLKRHFARVVDSQGTSMNCFQFITRLRQICNHGDALLPQSLRDWLRGAKYYSNMPLQGSQVCDNCEGEASQEEGSRLLDCYHQICSRCFTGAPNSGGKTICPMCDLLRRDSEVNDLDEKGHGRCSAAARPGAQKMNSGTYRPSSKVDALIHNLEFDRKAAIEAGREDPKSIVFSAWRGMLDLIAMALLQKGMGFERLDGSQTLKQRMASIQSFRSDPRCRLLLVTLGSGGVGIDLTIASRVHLMEPGWNPMLERQALDRVHRLGQTERVLTRCYVVEGQDSIEQYILETQKRKLDLASSLDEDGGQLHISQAILKEFREVIRS